MLSLPPVDEQYHQSKLLVPTGSSLLLPFSPRFKFYKMIRINLESTKRLWFHYLFFSSVHDLQQPGLIGSFLFSACIQNVQHIPLPGQLSLLFRGQIGLKVESQPYSTPPWAVAPFWACATGSARPHVALVQPHLSCSRNPRSTGLLLPPPLCRTNPLLGCSRAPPPAACSLRTASSSARCLFHPERAPRHPPLPSITLCSRPSSTKLLSPRAAPARTAGHPFGRLLDARDEATTTRSYICDVRLHVHLALTMDVLKRTPERPRHRPPRRPPEQVDGTYIKMVLD